MAEFWPGGTGRDDRDTGIESGLSARSSPETAEFVGAVRNQSDRSGLGLVSRHGQEIRFRKDEAVVKDAATAFREVLDKGRAELAGGDAQEVERRMKAISALVRAERDVADFLAAAHAQSPEEDEQLRRAELRRRIALFVKADLGDAPPEVLERIMLEGRAE
jgi:hypothetical protein